jgi:hypothetical protein
VPVPTLVSLLATERIADITSGDSHAVAVSENGQYYGWGKGFSLESQVEVVSFYPKRLSEIERDHVMMIEHEKPVTTRSTAILDLVNIQILPRKEQPRPATQMQTATHDSLKTK